MARLARPSLALACCIYSAVPVGVAPAAPATLARPAPSVRIDELIASARAEASGNCAAAVDIAWQAAEALWKAAPALSSQEFDDRGAAIWPLLLRCAHRAGRHLEAALAAALWRALPNATTVTLSDDDADVTDLLMHVYPAVNGAGAAPAGATIAAAESTKMVLVIATPHAPRDASISCWLDGHHLGACPQTIEVAPGPHFAAARPASSATARGDARLIWITPATSATQLELFPDPPPPIGAATVTPSPPAIARGPLFRVGQASPAPPRAAKRTAWWVYAIAGTAVASIGATLILYETRDQRQTILIEAQP